MAVGCGVLAVLLCVLWVRSYKWIDGISGPTPDGFEFQVYSTGGRIVCSKGSPAGATEDGSWQLNLGSELPSEETEAGNFLLRGFGLLREPCASGICIPHWFLLLLFVTIAAIAAVPSASLVPTFPRVTIGLAKHHFTHKLIKSSKTFCMHLIDEDHIGWVWHFGIPSDREIDKLHWLETNASVTSSPILAGALAWLDCRVETLMDTGDRTFYVAEVLEACLVQAATPLTLKRLLELAPADKLRHMNLAIERDINLDRNAILEWRRQRAIGG